MKNEFEEEMMNEKIINEELNKEIIQESEDYNLDEIEDYVPDNLLRELRRTLTDEEMCSIINQHKLEKERLLQENLHKYYHNVHLCEKCSRKFGTDDTVTSVDRFLCPLCDPPGRKDYSSILKRNSLS
jgi:hypothetical protein